jgi:hypothetical protein
MASHIRWACAVGFLAMGIWGAQRHVRLAASSASGGRSVVLAELFTSEGCSSCPPADEVLSQLVHSQPVAGVELLGLGEHVDYWDRLGWRDPFSSALFSSRQSNYDARVFHRNEVYTPQLVIDGRLQRVGSDVDSIRRAIKEAADAPKADVNVTVTPRSDRELSARVRVEMPASLKFAATVDVLVAVTEDSLVSEVRRGENHGRTLRHSAVVRSLTSIATLQPPERTWAMTAPIAREADWTLANLRVIGFLQERESRRIIGAGSAPVAALPDSR